MAAYIIIAVAHLSHLTLAMLVHNSSKYCYLSDDYYIFPQLYSTTKLYCVIVFFYNSLRTLEIGPGNSRMNLCLRVENVADLELPESLTIIYADRSS